MSRTKKESKYKLVILITIGITVLLIALVSLMRPKRVIPPALAKWRIAIVLDDWGYNLRNIPLLEAIRYPVTAAVLPNLKYSTAVAAELQQRGIQVILHLPMQPKENDRLERNTILTSMSEQEAGRIIADDLGSLHYAKGVSNHMGSAATENRNTMAYVFRELNKRQLFFLDSFTGKSVTAEIAHKYGVPFVKRDEFLDNKKEPLYIKGQLNRLKAKARAKGFAVGIGHDNKVTLSVLAELMPQIEREGYKFVFISDLVK